MCDSVWISEPWYHIDGIMGCIKSEVSEGPGVTCFHRWVTDVCGGFLSVFFLKIPAWLPGDFTLVDLQAPLGHVSHPLLALLAGVHGQVVDVRSFIRHFKVADAAVALSRRCESQLVRQTRFYYFLDDLVGVEPFRRGRRLQYRGHKRAEGRHCWCPAPAGSAARQSCSGEDNWGGFTDL